MDALKGLERSLGVPAGTALYVIGIIVAIIVVVAGRKFTSRTSGAVAGSSKRADSIVLAGPTGAGKTTLAYKVRLRTCHVAWCLRDRLGPRRRGTICRRFVVPIVASPAAAQGRRTADGL